MASKNPGLSRAELTALATNSHLAVCEFLNAPGILSILKDKLGKSKERSLLELMLRSKVPFEVKDREVALGKDPIVAKSTVSTAAQRLNEVLQKVSKQFRVLEEAEVAVAIPRRKGGAQVGYYFGCCRDIDGSYLDPEDVAQLLQKAFQIWKENNDKKECSGIGKYICDFGDFIEDRTREFVGRKFIFDSIDIFIEEHQSGYFFVRGDPGY